MEKYEAPILEMIRLGRDVITTSGCIECVDFPCQDKPEACECETGYDW